MPWWHERILGAYMSYWIYQHLGNLSPVELAENALLAEVRAGPDADEILRAFAKHAEEEIAGTRWSYHRDFGRTRLLVLDSRAGRVLDEQRREMLSGQEWAWVEECLTGDFHHLLIATSLPWLLSPGLHHLEAWNEAEAEEADSDARPVGRISASPSATYAGWAELLLDSARRGKPDAVARLRARVPRLADDDSVETLVLSAKQVSNHRRRALRYPYPAGVGASITLPGCRDGRSGSVQLAREMFRV